MIKKNKILFILIVFVVLILIAITYFILGIPVATDFTNPLDNTFVKDTIRFEILRNLLQLLLIVIIGGFITYFLKLAEEQRVQKRELEKAIKEEQQQDINIRTKYFYRLGEIYRSVKNIRRTLCAMGLTTKSKKDIVITEELSLLYAEQMQLLNQYQLMLEGLKIESKSIPSLSKITELQELLFKMEDYIRQILKEYERVILNLKTSSRKLSSLEKLNEFTTSVKADFVFSNKADAGKRFYNDFALSYRRIVGILGENLA